MDSSANINEIHSLFMLNNKDLTECESETMQKLNILLPNNGPLLIDYPYLDSCIQALEKISSQAIVIDPYTHVVRSIAICAGHLVYKCGNKIPIGTYQNLLTILTLILQRLEVDDKKHLRAITSCIKTVNIVLSESKQILDHELMERLVDIVMRRMHTFSLEVDIAMRLMHKFTIEVDSDLSDSSTQSHASRKSEVADTFLITSLHFITMAAKSTKLFMSYSNFYTDFKLPLIFTSKSYSENVQKAALSSLSSILLSCSKYFAFAISISTTRDVAPFTSFGENMGNLLRDIHQTLLNCFCNHNSTEITGALLNSLSTICEVTPYDRLNAYELLGNALKTAQDHLSSSPHESLMLMKKCFEKGAKLLDEIFDIVFDMMRKSTDDTLQSLAIEMLGNVTYNEGNFRKLEALNQFIKLILATEPSNIRVLSSLVTLIFRLDKSLHATDEWLNDYLGYVKTYLSSSISSVNEDGCKLVQNISNDSWNKVSATESASIFDTLANMTNSSSSYLQSAIFKTLGTLVEQDRFRGNSYLLKISDLLIVNISSDFQSVRYWIFWALANTMDIMDSSTLCLETQEILIKAMERNMGNVKLQVSILRIIWNLKGNYQRRFSGFVLKCLDSSNPKIQWNACRTASKFSDDEMISKLKELTESVNIKVKNSAEEALKSIQELYL